MAPSFFKIKELRRRPKDSFRTQQSTDSLSDASNGSNGTPTSGSTTPPSLAQRSDPSLSLETKEQSNGKVQPPPVPPRPPIPSRLHGSRKSVSGMAGLGSPQSGRAACLPVSQYSPRFTNVVDNSWVYQKVLLVHGTVGDPSQHSLDGTVTVSRLDDAFPSMSWPVCESQFKTLVYMMPGANRLRFDFASPKLANSGSSNPIHASYLTVHMLPPFNAPPLQLVILLAKDSPATYDAVPARIEREGNGLDTAIRKFRMAAYLWQAFTAESMWRNKLGRRTFRFEEEWTTGTANLRDRECGSMRSEARVHVVRTEKPLAELRDPNRAQQNELADDKDALFGIVSDAVKDYFKPLPGQKHYLSVLLLDSHWDPESKLVTGHAALGGSVGDLHLAVFGSHCLQSYPTSFEEVVPAFADCTPTDTAHVANDCNEAGSSWEAANIGIGAHLHETGHLFGLPHRESGIMLRDYVKLNRSFVTREAYSTRTLSKGGLVTDQDECAWHRLDCLHFRSHACFRLPNDPPLNVDDSVVAWPVENAKVLVVAATGIAYLELYADGDDVCHHWIEYLAENGLQRQVLLDEQELRNRLSEERRQRKFKVNVRSHGGGTLAIDDFTRLCSKESSFKLRSAIPAMGKMAFRGKRVGHSQMEGSDAHEVVLTSSLRPDRVLSRIICHHGFAVDGLEFVYDDDSKQLFGKRGGGIDYFDVDIRRGEYVTGFIVRAGLWIDAIQVLTSLGRKSPFFGNAHGGSAHTLIPPRGYTICGVSGTCGRWLDGFSVIIAR